MPRAHSPAAHARTSALRSPGLVLALLLALPLAACEAIEDGEVDAGEFEATVASDVGSASFLGDAYYTTLDRDGEPVFALFFFRDGLRGVDRDAYTYIALSRAGRQPGIGVFSIQNDDAGPTAFHGQYADLEDADDPEAVNGQVLSASGGVLSLTRFEAGLLTGSFRFDAVGLDLPDTDAFISGAVDGTFEARYLSPGVLEGLGVQFDLD